MPNQDVKSDVRTIVEDPGLSSAEKIDLLKRMHESVRAEMRAATESAVVNDNEVGDELKHIEEALDQLSADVASPEDGGGATL